MWMNLLKWVIAFLIEKLLGKLFKAYEEDKKLDELDKKEFEEIKVKVKRLKNAKTKEEIRSAINDLSL